MPTSNAGKEETANGQLKSVLRGPGRVLRSKSPDLVHQEVSAYLLVHYAINSLICQAATGADIDPDRISFLKTVNIVRRTATEAFPPEQWDTARAEILTALAARRDRNPERRHRSYPRVIKRARHNSYRVKRATDAGSRHAGPPTIKFIHCNQLPTGRHFAAWEQPEQLVKEVRAGFRSPGNSSPANGCTAVRLRLSVAIPRSTGYLSRAGFSVTSARR
ncbi:hypothetical protein [Streptomyces sp. NPDC005096]|uniref:hypothetical protein n=1 Tax=Streptomyces sp. NPDC005096 TaxID=3154559 RepID=UPI0033A6C46F